MFKKCGLAGKAPNESAAEQTISTHAAECGLVSSPLSKKIVCGVVGFANPRFLKGDKMILLKNDGLIEIKLITTMGTNVKNNDSPIGFFGTGLKFAIATLLRNDIKFYLYIGKNCYEFDTEKETIRGKEFQFCYMTGPMDRIELGFTTELGKNWEVWQAYRELYSNCIDEGGTVHHDKQSVKPEEDKTIFVIESDIDTGKCFLGDEGDKKLLFKNDLVEIYQGENDFIYYRGIRVKDLAKKSQYTYNLLQQVHLTEDRMIAYDWQIDEIITDAIASMDKNDIQKTVIASKPEYFERSLDFEYHSRVKPNSEFLKTVSTVSNPNPTVGGYIKKHTPPAPKTKEEKYTDFTKALLQLCEDYGVDNIQYLEGGAIQLSGGVLE